MRKGREAHRLRVFSRWVAGIAGFCFGVPLFCEGMRGVFTIGINDTWATMIGGVAGSLTLLPLTILGIFKPRIASRGMAACLAIFLFTTVVQMTFYAPLRIDRSDLPSLALWIAPVTVVATLLFYGSSSSTPDGGSLSADHNNRA